MHRIKALAPFAALSGECQRSLEEIASVRTFRKNHPLFVEGHAADSVYVLVAGAVSITRLHDDGREVAIEILGPGSMIGEVGLFGHPVRSAGVEALDTTTAVTFPSHQFKGLMLHYPELSWAVAEVLAERLRRANERLQDLALHDARGRIRAVLRRLAADHGRQQPDGGVTIPLRMRHSDIARLAGVSRETATRVMGSLVEEHELAVSHGRIVLSPGWSESVME